MMLPLRNFNPLQMLEYGTLCQHQAKYTHNDKIKFKKLYSKLAKLKLILNPFVLQEQI